MLRIALVPALLLMACGCPYVAHDKYSASDYADAGVPDGPPSFADCVRLCNAASIKHVQNPPDGLMLPIGTDGGEGLIGCDLSDSGQLTCDVRITVCR